MKNALKSCFGVFCFVLIIPFAQAQPQNKVSISGRVDFYSIPVNDPGTDVPDPTYNVNGKLGLNQAAYVDLNWWFGKNIGCSFGLGIHNFNYSADVFIPHVDPAFPPIVESHRTWSVLGLSPTFGLEWRSNKFLTHFCISNFQPIKIKKSSYIHRYNIHSYDPEAEIFHSIEVTEDITPSNSFETYNLWQLYFQYQLTENVGMSLGFETTLGKTLAYSYRIQIFEYDDLQVENKRIANDYKFLSYYRAITVGMSYTFELKKVVK